ncbi:MAG: hypothetical protein GKR89_12615 [Candidatus Latescibacteria bacterium]|nr:hypothetical protein [Candidatus Latescibacterota bacterium]
MSRTANHFYTWGRLCLGLLVSVSTWQCGGPTGGDDNPVLSVTPLTLDFGDTRTSLSFTITNAGSGTLDFSVQVPSEGWISLSQTNGIAVNNPVAVEVRIDREKAPTGTQEVKLVVTGALGARQEITLRALISRPAVLSVSPTTLVFGETSSQQQVTLRNDGGEALNWQAASAQGWISTAPQSGSLAPGDQAAVTVTIDRTDQPSGDIQGSVDFTSGGGSKTVVVQATIPNLPRPSVSPASLDFGTSQERLSVELRNIGGAVLEWTLEVSDAWIQPTDTDGSVPVGDTRLVFIDVSRQGLEPQAYQGSVTFRSVGGDAVVDIFMRISDEPVLELSVESLDIGIEPSFDFSVVNAGSGDLIWEISESEDWLELDRLQGATSAVPQVINGTIARLGLPAGEYSTNIRVESNAGSAALPLTMTVPEPGVAITSGPRQGETVGSDAVTFEFEARNTYGATELSFRLGDGPWSEWGNETTARFENLEESALAGDHSFQVRSRADAGQSQPLTRTFTVDAVTGPALRFAKLQPVENGATVEVAVVAEDVANLLGARIAFDYDPAKLELQNVAAPDQFWSANGGQVVQLPHEDDSPAGRLDLSVLVPGGRSQAGVSGTGAIAVVRFRARQAGVALLTWRPEAALRDTDGEPLAADRVDGNLTIE